MIKKAYEKYVLPKLLDACCSTKPVSYQRAKVVPNASGNILEIGIGSGLNLPYYSKSKITKLYGLDPSEELCEMANKNASKHSMDVEMLISGAEEIELPSRIIDTVLITYTLCSIPSPNAYPEYSFGFMPAVFKTFGCTIPQPKISNQENLFLEKL